MRAGLARSGRYGCGMVDDGPSDGERSSESSPEMESVRPSPLRRILGWTVEALCVVVGAVLIALVIRTFVGQMFIIPSTSMQNTLQVNDRVLVAKFGGFQRGDVVVFRDPGQWLGATPGDEPGIVQRALEAVGVLPDSSDGHLIKRVIGMPGDQVMLGDDSRIHVNGVALDESAYLFAQDGVQVAPATVPFDVVVPAGHIFVMGDHRNNSNDSRCRLTNDPSDESTSAFVPIDDVVGAAVALVAPLDRLATFQVPATFASVPAPAEPAPETAVLTHVEEGC